MKKDLTKGPVTKTMLYFAAPMILGNLLQQGYNIVDTLIVGRFLGADALAAVGSAYSLMTFLNAIIFSQKERTDLQLENTAASDAACFRSLCTAISNEFRNSYDTRACQQLWRIGDGSLCCCGKDRFVCLYASAGVQ